MTSSRHLLGKYQHSTDEDLGHKPSVFEKYSPLKITLINNTKSKTNGNKMHSKNKQDKYLVYNSQHSFAKFKDSMKFNFKIQ